MATILYVLQQQHEGMEFAADIMMSLEEMFAMRSRSTKRKAVIAFMNLWKTPGQAVKDHMMKVESSQILPLYAWVSFKNDIEGL